MTPESFRAISEHMIGIPAGDIVMRDEGTQTTWTVGVEAFGLAPYPVTREVYCGVRGPAPAGSPGPLTPMTEVSWIEAVQFCNLLSEATGLEACYSIGDGPDAHDVICHWGGRRLSPPVRGGVGVRLPGRVLRCPLRRAGRDRQAPRELRRRGTRRRDQGIERVGSSRHDRQRVGMVLGCLRPPRIRPVPRIPRRRLVRPAPWMSGVVSPQESSDLSHRRPRFPARPIIVEAGIRTN